MNQNDKGYLLTGSSGFFGKIIQRELHNVTTLDFSGDPDIKADISVNVDPLPKFRTVIHAAGKAHMIPGNDKEKEDFFRINHQGTEKLLKALEGNLPENFIFISTVAVYGEDTGENISEDHPLNGSTPYALSKIKAEEAISAWGRKFNVNTAILRLPLLAGPDPPGNLGAMINAIRKGYYFRIGDGSARRSMVLAEDVARFIPSLEGRNGIWHLTDGIHPSFSEIESVILKHTGRKHLISIPYGIAKSISLLGDLIPLLPLNSNRLKKITGTLTFSDEKSRNELGWTSRSVIGNINFH